MEVVASCPMLAAGFVWQSSAQSFAQTIIVKATFVLEPSHAKIAPREAWEPIYSEDRFVKNDPNGALAIPSDLVPYKRRVDVMVVGHTYAPDKRPVRSLVASVRLAGMHKSIEAVCDRGFRASDNRLLEGPRFTKMPLDWSRAAGGTGTTNPVGMRFDALPDALGLVSVPNLQPPKSIVTTRADAFAPIGLGPIAPRWPERIQKIQPFADRFSSTNWIEYPLPDNFDFEFFQSAPHDQQVAHLRPDELLVLKNLHPTHAHLEARLPGVSPRAVVHRASGEQEEVSFVADTLWIDTDRSLCSVVWRGSIGLRHPAEDGLVSVTLVEPAIDSSTESLIETIPPGVVDDDELLSMTKMAPFAIKTKGTTMPFVSAQIAKRSPNPVCSQDDGALPFGPSGLSGTPPAPIAFGQVTLPAQSPTSSPTVLASLVVKGSGAALPAERGRSSEQTPTADVTTPSLWAAEAASGAARTAVAPAASIETNQPRAHVRDLVQVLWYDEGCMKRIRDRGEFPSLSRVDSASHDIDAEFVHELLATAPPSSATNLHEMFERSVDAQGKFVSPVVVVAAELEVQFDELATLKAVISVFTALTTERVTEGNRALDRAKEFIQVPDLLAAPEICVALTSRIREAFVKEKNHQAADFLDEPVDDALIFGRHYQTRRVFGGAHIRCLLWAPEESSPWVAYLPVEVAQNLPLWKRFRVRVVSEMHPPQHRSEAPGKTLRVVALGRVEHRVAAV